jgi:hypothetical protein
MHHMQEIVSVLSRVCFVSDKLKEGVESRYDTFDDGESEPNYWSGYASGPKTDQHPPSLHPIKEQENQPGWIRMEPAIQCQLKQNGPPCRLTNMH